MYQDRIKNAYIKVVQLKFTLCEYSVKWEVCRKISLWSTVWLVSLDLPGALKNKIKSLKAIPNCRNVIHCWAKTAVNCRCPVILRCIAIYCLPKLAMGRPLYCQPAPLSICQPQSSSQNRMPQTSKLSTMYNGNSCNDTDGAIQQQYAAIEVTCL